MSLADPRPRLHPTNRLVEVKRSDITDYWYD